MKKRYKIGDKVKLSPDSEYVCQSGGTIGEIIEFLHTLPEEDDNILQTKYYYRVKFENGELNSYRCTDLIPAEEETLIKKEKDLKQQAVERFGFISKDDKFTIFDKYCYDRTIQEEDPANWTICSDGLYLATFGQGGLCLYKDGKWAERTSLPKNWTVKCAYKGENQPELVEWRKEASDYKFKWDGEGWLDETGHWEFSPTRNKGIITYDQFLKWVYNPWKALQSVDESIKPGDWVIGWHNDECELYHTPWKVEKFDSSGIYLIPEGHNGWNCNISHLRKVPAPQQSPSSMEKEWKPKFKAGDRVRVIKQTHGWGCVGKGDVGTVIRKSSSFEEEDVYFVNFGELKAINWKGYKSCFELVEESMQGEFVYSPPELSPTDSEYKLQLGDTSLVRVITSNGISSEFKNEQSINLSIYKPKKVKQLKL